jgi:hypothetical protein
MMVTGYEEMTTKMCSRVRMPMEIRNVVNNRSLFGLELPISEEPFDPNIVVSREHKNRDMATDCIEDPGDFCPFLPGKRGNTVFYIPEKDKTVRCRRLDSLQKPVETFATMAPEMQATCGKIGFDPEMKIGNDEHALGVFY